MTYQYLYCAACGSRRAGHGYQCSVCGGPLRHDVAVSHPSYAPSVLHTSVRAPQPARQPQSQPERQPVAA